MFWRWSKRIGFSLGCLIAVLLIGGASYQFSSTKLDISKYPNPGKMVDVGYKMHLLEEKIISNLPHRLQSWVKMKMNLIPKGDAIMDIALLLQECVDENEAVGAVVGLIDHGKVQFFSYGKKSIKENEPISEDTIFEIGSISKVFTTLVLMDMVSNREMQLDDPIEVYLTGVKVPEMNGEKITLRHLATHHSGLPSLPDNFTPQNLMNPYADYTTEDLYHFLNNHSLQRAPGEQFEYSNIGMGLLGHILSKKTGQSYEKLVLNRICATLGMKNTSITLTADMEKHFAKGYHLKKEMEYWDIPTLAGAGALRSNIKDMARFLSANLGLFNSSVTDLLKQCHKKQCAAGAIGDIGLGWIISHSDDADIIWHNGGTGGFRTFLGFNSKTRRGIIVLSNSTQAWTDSFALSVLDPANNKKPIIDKALVKNLDYLKRFEGSYEGITVHDQQKIDVAIKLCDSQLLFSIPHGDLKLMPESFGVFDLKGTGQKLQFILDESGGIVKAQVTLPNNAIAAEIMPKK